MKRLLVAFVVLGLSTVAWAGDMDKTCGQHIAEKAVLPSKMSEVMTNVANMMDAHAAFMLQDKSKESKQEAAALKKLSAQHRKLAAEMKKTADMMSKMGSLPGAPHDMNKMMADQNITKAMNDMLTSQKEFNALLSKDISEMESMMKGGAGAHH